MRISLNWLKTHLNLPEEPEQIAGMLTNCGLEVEDITVVGAVRNGLEGLVIGEVMEVTGHPNADRLRLTKVDTGTQPWLSIVCGAPNVAKGQKVVVAPVGSTIYPTGKDPVTMKPAKIRGEVSEGMICAEDEIGMGNNHEGILVLAPECVPGRPASDYLKPETDVLLEIGLTPNRGDAASHLGVARDLKAILNRPLTQPVDSAVHWGSDQGPVTVIIDESEACGRYSGVVIQNIQAGPSPQWLQKRLSSIGVQPILNAVDITNFIMFDIGQPMHAFDADKLSGLIHVRYAKKGETLRTLDKQLRNLQGQELIIADDSGPIALAGVMGGLNTAITKETRNIFLESAWFDPACVRKTAKIHGLSTDSSFRFERGINPEITLNALARAAEMILETAGGVLPFKPVDILTADLQGKKISLSYDKINSVVGTVLDPQKVLNIVSNLDMEILSEGRLGMELSLPLYRMDVTRDIDVIEEILRIYGFDNVPFPGVVHSAAVVTPKPDKHAVRQTICNYLTSGGFCEIMTNSLVSETFVEAPDSAHAVHLLNPLSNDLALLRTSLKGSVLEAIAYNKNRKAHDLKFFEFGKIYRKKDTSYTEYEVLCLMVTGNTHEPHWRSKAVKTDYYYLKSICENLLSVLGVSENIFSGVVQIHKDLLDKAGIKEPVWYAELNMDRLMNALSGRKFRLQEIPVYPEVTRDLSLVINQNIQYDAIRRIVHKTLGNYLRKLTLFDVFEGKPLEEGKKSYSFSMVLYDSAKTMTDKQIDALMQKLMNELEQQLQAVIRK